MNCDRCGGPDNDTQIIFGNPLDCGPGFVYLCLDCTKDLREWVATAPTREAVQARREKVSR